MGEVVHVLSFDELELQARAAVQHAWKTRRAQDYERADTLYARWFRLRRYNKSGPKKTFNKSGPVAVVS